MRLDARECRRVSNPAHASTAPGSTPPRGSPVLLGRPSPPQRRRACRCRASAPSRGRAPATSESTPVVRSPPRAPCTRRPAERRARAGCGRTRRSRAARTARARGQRWRAGGRHRLADSHRAARSGHRHQAPSQSATTRCRSHRDGSCEPGGATAGRLPLFRRRRQRLRFPRGLSPPPDRAQRVQPGQPASDRRASARCKDLETDRRFRGRSCAVGRRQPGPVPRAVRAAAARVSVKGRRSQSV